VQTSLGPNAFGAMVAVVPASLSSAPARAAYPGGDGRIAFVRDDEIWTVSNLGSSLGAAVAGTIPVSSIGDRSYAAAMIVLACIGIVGLVATLFIPARRVPVDAARSTP
jgi:hypothetical protein